MGSRTIRKDYILSNKDIKTIKRFMNTTQGAKAEVYGKEGTTGGTDADTRDTIRYNFDFRDWPTIAKKFSDYISIDNLETNQFDLLEYGEGMFFTVHQDNMGGNVHQQHTAHNMTGRVWSSSTMIDCTDDLEGGDLIIYGPLMPSNNKMTVKLKKGQTVFFPSHFFHEVTPVTKGRRKVLVAWVGANNKKISIRHELRDKIQSGRASFL
jgi:Rps23 Pro-64 3,4-dihydroxylase Tpa1-like proline 4-hydroxylase|tara:strand:- start:25836 stop:26462 length:627 start_codon:yes stop_codon:yes gene_type:complete